MTDFFVGEKEKWTNKGTDKQYVADSLLHSTTCQSYLMFVPNFKILSQVVSEKCLTEKKFTNKQTNKLTTNIVTEKAKTIRALS